MESKKKTMFLLTYALRETRAGKDIGLIDVAEGETVAEISFVDGSTVRVNIECDSALAAIIDVCKALM